MALYFLTTGGLNARSPELNICVKSGPAIVIAQGNTVTWSQDVNIVSDIVIKEGGKLVITSQVGLAENVRITVFQDGILHLDGGRLYNSCTNTRWDGIAVRGNKNLFQQLWQGVRFQGLVTTSNGAVIEGANIGIRNFDPDAWDVPGGVMSTTGGIIIADSSTFRNNRIGVFFWPYENYDLYYYLIHGTKKKISDLSFFRACHFIADNNFGSDYASFSSMAYLRGVWGIRFTGCTFINSKTGLSYIDQRKMGIRSENSTFAVREEIIGPPVIDPCSIYEYRPSLFRGFSVGISAESVGIHPFSVSNTTFEENATAIYAKRTNGFSAIRNAFVVGAALPFQEQNPVWPIPFSGIHADACTGYRIEENIMREAGEIAWFTKTVGIAVSQSGSESNLVYKNTLKDLYCANVANGNNRGSMPDLGLRYECNKNEANEFDFAVKGALTGVVGISAMQGAASRAAGNTFSDIVQVPGSDVNFQNLGEPLTYYWQDDPLYIPVNYSVSTITLSQGNFTPCLSRLPNCKRLTPLSNEEINILQGIVQNGADTTEIHQAANELARHYLMHEDSIQLDSARFWLMRKGSLEAYFTAVDVFLHQEDTTSARQLLDDIPNALNLTGHTQDEYDYFYDLKNIQMQAMAYGYTDSQMVAANLNELEDLAQAGHYHASTQAQVWLNIVTGAGYRTPIILPEHEPQNLAAPLPGSASYDDGEEFARLSVAPNPAAGETVFHYRLPEGMERAHIVITTMEGKPIARIPADTAARQVRWSTEGRQSGIYFYYLTVGSKSMLSGRLVIPR